MTTRSLPELMWSGADIAKALEIPPTTIYRAVRKALRGKPGGLIPDAMSERTFLFRTGSLRRVLDSLACQLTAVEYAKRVARFDLFPTVIDAKTVELKKVETVPVRQVETQEKENFLT